MQDTNYPIDKQELNRPRKGIDRAVFDKELKSLKHDIAPGLGCIQNEYFLALLINPNRQATPEARDTANNLHTFANNVVQGQLPEYFYEGYCASLLVPASKEHPEQLNPGNIQECRPINIGNAERHLIEQAYFDEGLQEAYVRILGPVQNKVGIRDGISIRVQVALDANPDFAIF